MNATSGLEGVWILYESVRGKRALGPYRNVGDAKIAASMRSLQEYKLVHRDELGNACHPDIMPEDQP